MLKIDPVQPEREVMQQAPKGESIMTETYDFIEKYLGQLKATLDHLDRKEILDFIHVLAKAREDGATIYVIGNGGSAATASHMVCDLNKGAGGFRFVCLTDNIPSVTAYGNDLSYDDIFIAPLRTFLRPTDLLLCISGSGNSKNIIKAAEYAKTQGNSIIGFTGYSGGRLKELADYSVNANVDDMQLSEDVHMILVHIAMRSLCATASCC
jgi:D-sedoheptulose 7-phosphate isomerase